MFALIPQPDYIDIAYRPVILSLLVIVFFFFLEILIFNFM